VPWRGEESVNVLEAVHVSKEYPGTVALKDVSVSFESGKIHALIGKNGSGKSTLVKIFSGAIAPTRGKALENGKELRFGSPAEAFQEGIATVYQELSLSPYLSVAENILMGRLPRAGLFVDWKRTYAMAEEMLNKIGVSIPPSTLIADLPIWQCQIVEVLKAMSYNPKVLILDEPTSSLSVNEVKNLFRCIRQLVSDEVIIIFITHRLEELWELVDTCTVLRDGELIGKLDMKTATRSEILKMMFGDVEVKKRNRETGSTDEVVLKDHGLTQGKRLHDVSFELHRGEILGIAGMLGAGRTELLRSIFGADPFESGEIWFQGKKITSHSPRTMKGLGFALAPEDRKQQGLNQIMSVKENLTLAALSKLTRRSFISRKKERELSERQVRDLEIKVSSLDLPVSSLSGGNQQKVVVGNWLNSEPRVMFFDEPSRGIDVNAKQQIFQIIWEQSRKGISSIVVSSELEELLEVCHRILIMRNGRITGERLAEGLKLDDLYLLCMGAS
jgi:ribose transport system ATP-binding protein